MKEIETKILNVNKDEVIFMLKKLGAERIGEYNYIRELYQVSNNRILRIRTDGMRHTITMKERQSDALDGTDEYEIGITDYEIAKDIFTRCFKKHGSIKNKRILYSMDGAEISIDKWPGIPWLVEIEGSSMDEVIKIQRKLNIKGDPVGNISAADAYRKYGLEFRNYLKISD